MKKTIETSSQTEQKDHKSYSIKEILSMGSVENFVKKLDKKPSRILKKLSTIPNENFLTLNEANAALHSLETTK
jgi:hypothetical protein